MSFPEGLRELSPDARMEMLAILTSPPDVRSAVIRSFHERGKADMVELLILLEEREWARQAAIEALEEAADD